MFKLVIQDDEGKTTVVPLIRDEITVGRKEGNTIRLTERNVSRRHARIVRNNGTVAIEDLESYNGVRVNGSRIKGRQPLTVSDRIQIGDYLIELKTDSDENLVSTSDDQLTQPIEKPEPPGAGPTGSIPIPQVGPNAETTKMPSQLVTHQHTNEMFNGAASAAATPAPMLEPSPASAPTPATATEAPAGKGSKASRKAKGSPDATPVTDEARHARLVVVSSNFAGVEYELTEPSTVLGRTDENDIVINHRSISRNHAKIVREGASFTIVDLQSSNGVRVNNEEYDKVQLHRGDLVDLGHVRLRFADPGDDYIFKPEDVSDVSTGGGKGVWYALLAVLVVLVGVGLFALFSDGTASGKDRQQGSANGTDATSATAGGASKSDFDALMAEAQKAIEQGDWSVARVKAHEAQGIAGSDTAAHQTAQQVIDLATKEETAKTQLEALKQAVARTDHAKIREHYGAIDQKSAYHEDAKAAHDGARDAYIEKVRGEAEAFNDARNCGAIRNLQIKAEKQWPEAGEQIREIHEMCQRPGKPPNGPVVNPTRPPKPPVEQTPPPDDTTRDDPDGPINEPRAAKSFEAFEALVTEATDAAKVGQYGRARRACSEALGYKPREPNERELYTRAIYACAIAACNLTNQRLAKRYYDMASTTDQKSAIYKVCLTQGIDLRQ